MGGAIVLMLHRKEPTFWDGAILVAPMCKVTSQQFVFFFQISLGALASLISCL